VVSAAQLHHCTGCSCNARSAGRDMQKSSAASAQKVNTCGARSRGTAYAAAGLRPRPYQRSRLRLRRRVRAAAASRTGWQCRRERSRKKKCLLAQSQQRHRCAWPHRRRAPHIMMRQQRRAGSGPASDSCNASGVRHATLLVTRHYLRQPSFSLINTAQRMRSGACLEADTKHSCALLLRARAGCAHSAVWAAWARQCIANAECSPAGRRLRLLLLLQPRNAPAAHARRQQP
jgi:hypothetical protein